MLFINRADGTISLTRGDTARLTVSLINDSNNSEYQTSLNDELVLSVKRSIKDENVIFQKKVKGSNTFHITPSDTSGMQFGKYKYDVQLTKENGDIYTVIEPSCFEIRPEVTC